MATDRKMTAAILRQLADCLDASSASDVNSLSVGESKLLIVSKARASNKPTESKRRNLEDEEIIGRLVEQVASATTREEGTGIIDSAELSRRSLETLVRAFGLPVRKDDNIQRLKQRIVEATIEARLNTRAIRGS